MLFQIAETRISTELVDQWRQIKASVVPTPCAFGFYDRINAGGDVAEREGLDEILRSRPLR